MHKRHVMAKELQNCAETIFNAQSPECVYDPRHLSSPAYMELSKCVSVDKSYMQLDPNVVSYLCLLVAAYLSTESTP